MSATQRRLLARLATVDPRFVSLSAPPGYGKTDLAGAWARRFERHAACDCTGLEGLCDFAVRLLAALGNESDAEHVGRVRLSLHACGAGECAWIRAVLECWKARRERSLLVLRNAGAIARDARALALFGDLLAARPAERALVVLSNEPLPLEVARYVAPHQVLELTREQLQLDAVEAAELLEDAGVTPATTERILALCAGSPIALQLLARIAHYETDVDRLLDRLRAAKTNLHHQLLAEVLSALTPEMRSAMLAVAAIPHASLEDIAAAAGIEHAGPIVDGLLRLPGFIAYDSGSCEMHPLLLAALRDRHGTEFPGYVLRAARKNESHGDYLHAAELYGIAGDSRAASAALDRLPPARWQQPSTRLIDVLQRVPVAELLARANCWLALLPYRRPAIEASQLFDEATQLQTGASSDVRRRLGVRRALLAAACNRLGDAAAALDEAGGAVASADLGQERRIGLVAAALVAAKGGRFSEADLCLERADAIYDAPGGRFETERTEIAVAKASMHGEWDELLRLAEERLAAAIHAGPAQRIARAARTVAVAAWFRNDDERAAAARRIVEDCGETEDDDLAAAALADLRVALEIAEAEQAAALFDRAVERVDTSDDLFLRVVVRVCAGLLVPAQRRRLLEARTIAARIESPPLQTSIELLVDSPELRDCGVFKNLVDRIVRAPIKTRHERLFVDVLRGHVRRGSDVLRVSDRGLELLAALSLFEPGTTNDTLAAALWPRLERRAAVNALKVCVSRTRAQLHDRESICNARSGYALGDHVRSDVRELERLSHLVRGGVTLGESLRLQLAERSGVAERLPAHAAGWEWFAPYAAYLNELRRELAHALAQDAARRELKAERQPIAT